MTDSNQDVKQLRDEIERLSDIVAVSHEYIRHSLNLNEDDPLRFDYYAKEIDRLREKCDMQAKILRSLTPERYPDVLFIHAHLGEKDQNGMPERLLVVPAYGVDFSYIYQRTDKTTGPEW